MILEEEMGELENNQAKTPWWWDGHVSPKSSQWLQSTLSGSFSSTCSCVRSLESFYHHRNVAGDKNL